MTKIFIEVLSRALAFSLGAAIGFFLIALLMNFAQGRDLNDKELIPLHKPVTYAEVQPVFITNCAGCHNASTPETNWLDEQVATSKKDVIFKRVYKQGDMPLFLKYFSWDDKELLKRWLVQQRPVLDEEFVEKVKR